MKSLSRTTTLKIAAAISFLVSAVSVVGALPLVTQGAATIGQSSDQPPFVVIMIALLAGVVGLVGVYPTWRGLRMGIVLTISANLVNGLSALPGLLFAPTPSLMIAAGLTVAFSVLIIVFCLWRDRRPALA
jgi:hypothetical protein